MIACLCAQTCYKQVADNSSCATGAARSCHPSALATPVVHASQGPQPPVGAVCTYILAHTLTGTRGCLYACRRTDLETCKEWIRKRWRRTEGGRAAQPSRLVALVPTATACSLPDIIHHSHITVHPRFGQRLRQHPLTLSAIVRTPSPPRHPLHACDTHPAQLRAHAAAVSRAADARRGSEHPVLSSGQRQGGRCW